MFIIQGMSVAYKFVLVDVTWEIPIHCSQIFLKIPQYHAKISVVLKLELEFFVSQSMMKDEMGFSQVLPLKLFPGNVSVLKEESAPAGYWAWMKAED